MELYKAANPVDTWPYRYTAAIYADIRRPDDAIAELRKVHASASTSTAVLFFFLLERLELLFPLSL